MKAVNAAVNVQIQAFTSSLARAGRVMQEFSCDERLPDHIRVLASAFEDAIPPLRAIRNSVEYIEDRTRGLREGKQPIVGLTAGFNLNRPQGDSYSILLADGCYGTIELSDATLDTANNVGAAFFRAMTVPQS